jgi:hypothetical protein
MSAVTSRDQMSTSCEFRNRGRTIEARCTRSDEGVRLYVSVFRSGRAWMQNNSLSVVRSTLNRALVVAELELGLCADDMQKLRELLNG